MTEPSIPPSLSSLPAEPASPAVVRGVFIVGMASLARLGIALADGVVGLWCRLAVRRGEPLADSSLLLERVDPALDAAAIVTSLAAMVGFFQLARRELGQRSAKRILIATAIVVMLAATSARAALLSPALVASLGWRTHGLLHSAAIVLEAIAMCLFLYDALAFSLPRERTRSMLRAAAATFALLIVATLAHPFYFEDPFDDSIFAWTLRAARSLPFGITAAGCLALRAELSDVDDRYRI